MDSQQKNTKLIAVFAVIFSVIIFFAAFLTMWFWGDKYSDFEAFAREVEIPGLDDGATPQGMTSFNYKSLNEDGSYSEKLTQDYVFISAYFKNAPSRIYVTGSRTGYVGYVTVRLDDDTVYSGHAGGIATNGYTFWLGAEDTVLCMRTDTKSGYKHMADEIIKTAQKNGEVAVTGSFKVACNASFLGYYDDPTSTYNDKLYVGEFYNKSYETSELHKYTYYKDMNGKLIDPEDYIVEKDRFYEKTKNDDGETVKGDEVKYKKITNQAVMFAYTAYISENYNISNKYGLNTTTENELKKSVPSIYAMYSLPDEIQGVTMSARVSYNDKGEGTVQSQTMVLSQSYSLKNSNIMCYDFSKISTSSMTYANLTGKTFVYPDAGKANNTNLSVYFVDEFALIRNYSVPSMSEGICTVLGKRDNRVFVLFESAANKYKAFVRQKLNNVYSFVPPDPAK